MTHHALTTTERIAQRVDQIESQMPDRPLHPKTGKPFHPDTGRPMPYHSRHLQHIDELTKMCQELLPT